MKSEKWVIQRVKVGAGEVAKIDFKLPATVNTCTGIACTVSDIEGAFSVMYPFGQLSLSFNNNADRTLVLQSDYQQTGYRMGCILFKLEQSLQGGSRVTGFYHNLKTNPHLLRIYLQCIAEIN